jgi:hypothetical protein
MSQERDLNKLLKTINGLVTLSVSLSIMTLALVVYYMIDPNLSVLKSKTNSVATNEYIDPDRIENGIHVRTGLIEAEGLMTVVNNCTNCHSSKLVIQNRMNEERWNATIKWMQETQNLWNLGDNQAIIVNYLVSNYPPKSKGRREKLSNIEWYQLNN